MLTSLLSYVAPLAPLPRFDGRPTLVVGSGPNGRPPGDLGQWATFTVNASQVVLEKWNVPVPDFTIFGGGMFKSRIDERSTAKAFANRRTKHLLAFRVPKRYPSLMYGLWRAHYRYDQLSLMEPQARDALVKRIIGMETPERPRPSNGIILALLACHMGGSPVLMTGFSLTQDGHAYKISATRGRIRTKIRRF